MTNRPLSSQWDLLIFKGIVCLLGMIGCIFIKYEIELVSILAVLKEAAGYANLPSVSDSAR